MAKKNPNKHHDIDVTVKNDTFYFSPNYGNCTVAAGATDSIIWIVGKGSKYKFTNIRFNPRGPFTKSVQPDRIVVIDKNQNASKPYKDYKYYITVELESRTGSQVKSLESPDPRIRNISF